MKVSDILKETIIDITPELKQRQDAHEEQARAKRFKERLAKLQARRKDKKDPDELGAKRRSKLSQADQLRDIARQLRNKNT